MYRCNVYLYKSKKNIKDAEATKEIKHLAFGIVFRYDKSIQSKSNKRKEKNFYYHNQSKIDLRTKNQILL